MRLYGKVRAHFLCGKEIHQPLFLRIPCHEKEKGVVWMQTLLTVRSLTYAQKGAAVLDQAWIHARVIRAPEQYSRRGCSYALLVRGNGEKETKILEAAGVKVLGRYPYDG